MTLMVPKGHYTVRVLDDEYLRMTNNYDSTMLPRGPSHDEQLWLKVPCGDDVLEIRVTANHYSDRPDKFAKISVQLMGPNLAWEVRVDNGHGQDLHAHAGPVKCAPTISIDGTGFNGHLVRDAIYVAQVVWTLSMRPQVGRGDWELARPSFMFLGSLLRCSPPVAGVVPTAVTFPFFPGSRVRMERLKTTPGPARARPAGFGFNTKDLSSVQDVARSANPFG